MENQVPVSPRQTIEGIVHFRRMVDKIRLRQANRLASDYLAKLGKGFDDDCCEFLSINYEEVVRLVEDGASDEEVLEKVLLLGRAPSSYETEVWSAYLSKRGWRDGSSDNLKNRKGDLGLADRDDVQTFFDLIDADEGRPLN